MTSGFHDDLVAKASDPTFIQNVKVAGWINSVPSTEEVYPQWLTISGYL
jgi:hypothetical protein